MTSADWYYALPRTLDNIHRVASLTRDRLSLEAWRTLNDFYASRRWRADAMPTAMGDALRLLDDGLRVLAAFHGLTHENMTRNFGWSFLDMGRRLSRAHNLAEVLLGIFGKARAATTKPAACCSCSSSPTASSPTARAIGWRPCCLWCSICCCSTRAIRAASPSSSQPCRGHIDTLPQSGQGSGRSEEQRMALSLLSQMRLADMTALGKPEPDGARPGLQKLLSAQMDALPVLSDIIGRRYFNLTEKNAKWSAPLFASGDHDLRRQSSHEPTPTASRSCSRTPRAPGAARKSVPARDAPQHADRTGPIFTRPVTGLLR